MNARTEPTEVGLYLGNRCSLPAAGLPGLPRQDSLPGPTLLPKLPPRLLLHGIPQTAATHLPLTWATFVSSPEREQTPIQIISSKQQFHQVDTGKINIFVFYILEKQTDFRGQGGSLHTDEGQAV